MIMDFLSIGCNAEMLSFAAAFLAIALFIAAAARRIGEKSRNRHAPRLNVKADVVSKRAQIKCPHISMNHPLNPAQFSYYVTFLMEGGDWMELRLPQEVYRGLDEGDCGMLTFQGTRYIAFDH